MLLWLLLLMLLPEGSMYSYSIYIRPKYLNRDYFKAKFYTIWVNGL